MAIARTVRLVVILPLLLGACSSEDDPGSTTAGTASVAPTGPTQGTGASPSSVEDPLASIEIDVGGRVIAGSCSGEGEPTVILDAGLGNPGTQLAPIASELESETRVCSYDRAGNGASDAVNATRTLSDVVEDLNAFLEGSGIPGPYVLVGQSIGGTVVMRYAQVHPETVAGFVSMNPVAPYSDWVERAATVETKDELRTLELSFYRGSNDEAVDLRDSDLILEEPMPPDIPYTVLYAEDCPGEFCDRIRPVLEDAMADLAELNDLGTFVAVKGAGHEIFASDLDEVLAQITRLIEGDG